MTERVVRLLKRWAGVHDPTAGSPAHTMAEMTESYSPHADELFERIRAVCPSFVPVDDAAAPEWTDEPHPLAYIRIAGLARHLTRLAADGRIDLVQPVLDLVEETLQRPDEYIEHLLIEGLLEDLQNASLQTEGKVELVAVRARLGPRSRTAWDELMRFWHGSPDRARTPRPPAVPTDDDPTRLRAAQVNGQAAAR